MTTPFVSINELKERLRPLLEGHDDAAVVFDADGTLWSHDVGCMVFDEAVNQGAFKAEALDALLAEARSQRLEAPGTSANDIARALQQAWYAGVYEEKSAAEMQVWAYIGFFEAEFRDLTRLALHRGRHMATLHEEVLDLARWVRSRGARACIVSASPQWVVEEASRDLGFDVSDIIAGVPNTNSSEGETRIQPGLRAPLPYGPGKATAGRALLGNSKWVASLGDSGFDLAMMAEAHVGVGIGNKPALLDGLREMPHAVRLLLSGSP
jgi:phosphoserine phosphatase